MNFQQAFNEMPLIAILRGVEPENVLSTVKPLIEAGFRLIEIPLNSPQPFLSIQRAVDAYGDVAMFGAGTVTTLEKAKKVVENKGKLIVAPNLNEEIGEFCVANDAIWLPGVMTLTEAYKAHYAGAQGLKIFPSDIVGPEGIKAMRAVLAKEVLVLPVGGVTPDTMESYVSAGANGFGLGSALYRAGDDPAKTARNAQSFVDAAKRLFPNLSA